MTSASSKIWEAYLPGVHSIYLTNATKYVNPGDISLSGNAPTSNYGWNSDTYPSEESNYGPVLGRGNYKITVIDNQNHTIGEVNIDCYGTHFAYRATAHTDQSPEQQNWIKN